MLRKQAKKHRPGVEPPEQEDDEDDDEDGEPAEKGGGGGPKPGREIKLTRGDPDAHRPATAGGSRARALTPPRAPGREPNWAELLAHATSGRGHSRDEVLGLFRWMGFELAEMTQQQVLDRINERVDGGFLKAARDKPSFLREVWRAVFFVADADDSGEVSRDELMVLITDVLGAQCTDDVADRVMQEYDADGSGLIEADEFGELARHVFEPAVDVRKGPLVEQGDRAPWVAPSEGVVDVKFACPPGAASADEVGSDEGVEGLLRLLRAAESEAERTVIFDVATSQTEIFVTAEQARNVFKAAHCEHSAVEKVARLLPQLASARDACQFAETALPSRPGAGST